jgi:hypothetical protein
MAQAPNWHAGVPLLVEQATPQAPQLLGLLEVLVSQPLLTLWSQSLKPELQA